MLNWQGIFRMGQKCFQVTICWLSQESEKRKIFWIHKKIKFSNLSDEDQSTTGGFRRICFWKNFQGAKHISNPRQSFKFHKSWQKSHFLYYQRVRFGEQLWAWEGLFYEEFSFFNKESKMFQICNKCFEYPKITFCVLSEGEDRSATGGCSEESRVGRRASRPTTGLHKATLLQIQIWKQIQI